MRAELGQLALREVPGLAASGEPPRIDTLMRIAHALDCDLDVELRARAKA